MRTLNLAVFMRGILLSGALGLLVPTWGHAQGRGRPRAGNVVREPWVHDPAMAKEGDTYYLYSTGYGISCLSSKDLCEWTVEQGVFPSPPEWATDSIKGYGGHTWAPDVIYHQGNYHLFYSCSTFGKNRSAIGHAFRKTLDASSGEPWTDTGAVIVSHPRDDFNAIDPNVVIDEEGNPWLAFGSFWGGIRIVRLTGDLTSVSEPEEMYTICTRRHDGPSEGAFRRENAVEAPFIFRHGDYYYLFVSFDHCCRGLKSDYKVMVGRSARVTGPYVDKDGRELTRGGGSLVVDSSDEFVAIGHSAAYHLDGKDYFMAHGYSRAQGGVSKLFLREMTWDDEGWPIVPATGK